jgi:hypothetical protein
MSRSASGAVTTKPGRELRFCQPSRRERRPAIGRSAPRACRGCLGAGREHDRRLMHQETSAQPPTASAQRAARLGREKHNRRQLFHRPCVPPPQNRPGTLSRRSDTEEMSLALGRQMRSEVAPAVRSGRSLATSTGLLRRRRCRRHALAPRTEGFLFSAAARNPREKVACSRAAVISGPAFK